MNDYEYWHCSDNPREGFGVKDKETNTYFAGDEVIDLINALSFRVKNYEKKYKEEKELVEHYRAVMYDLMVLNEIL